VKLMSFQLGTSASRPVSAYRAEGDAGIKFRMEYCNDTISQTELLNVFATWT
jgi:hypothetical protein